MAITANHHRFFAVTNLVARSTNRGDTEADQEDHRCAADPPPGLYRVRQRLAGLRLPRDAERRAQLDRRISPSWRWAQRREEAHHARVGFGVDARPGA